MQPRDDENGYAILRSIRRIIRRVSRHSHALARESGLTVPQLLCLKAVAESEADEVTLSVVADEVGLSPSTVSGILDRLVRSGLVERERSDRDRRRVLLSVSEAGAARLADVPAPLQERFLERLGGLDAEERQRILSALERVVELMDAEDLDAAPLLVGGSDLREG